MEVMSALPCVRQVWDELDLNYIYLILIPSSGHRVWRVTPKGQNFVEGGKPSKLSPKSPED